LKLKIVLELRDITGLMVGYRFGN